MGWLKVTIQWRESIKYFTTLSPVVLLFKSVVTCKSSRKNTCLLLQTYRSLNTILLILVLVLLIVKSEFNSKCFVLFSWKSRIKELAGMHCGTHSCWAKSENFYGFSECVKTKLAKWWIRWLSWCCGSMWCFFLQIQDIAANKIKVTRYLHEINIVLLNFV